MEILVTGATTAAAARPEIRGKGTNKYSAMAIKVNAWPTAYYFESLDYLSRISTPRNPAEGFP